MTILCLVRDQKDGSWVAFSDCLITSEERDRGVSLSTPLRPSYGSKRTFGFFEAALEQKLGLVENDVLMGWSGSRLEAVQSLTAYRNRTSDVEIDRIFFGRSNCYLFARGHDRDRRVIFCGPQGSIKSITSCGYEFIFAGSGGRIMEGLKFTAKHGRLGEGAPNVAAAALTALSRFMSEELAGQTSQFYSLRTGGHYQLFYQSPSGIKQLFFAMNHWVMGQGDEPLVTKIIVPFIKESFETSVEVEVKDNWRMGISNAVAVAPLLESPRRDARLSLVLPEVLSSKLADFTFHFCWKKNEHRAFISSLQEPTFKFSGDEFQKNAHQERTVEIAKQLLSN